MFFWWVKISYDCVIVIYVLLYIWVLVVVNTNGLNSVIDEQYVYTSPESQFELHKFCVKS